VNAVRLLAAGALLAGPTVIAFFSGGYFDEPREIGGIAAWVLVAIAAVGARRPFPRRWPGILAIAALAGLAGWIALSLNWSPLAGPTQDDLQRVLFYLGAVIAAAALLGPLPARRCVEPALAFGAFVVIAYGLSGRLLPSIIHLAHSHTALGRLEQPLTYWNAMGVLAAMGFVLATRVAGDASRHGVLRLSAAATAPALAVGVYLSFSRGALAAAAVGLVVLMALAPERRQGRVVVLLLGTGIVAAIASGLLPAVRALQPAHRNAEGAAMLVVLLVLMAVAAGGVAWLHRREAAGRLRSGPLRLPRPRLVITVCLVLLLAATLGAAALEQRPGTPEAGASTSRLASVKSNRYDYWRVALEEFADNPIHGAGSGAFRVDWLRKRSVFDPALDAHSLYIETLGELGLVGSGILAALLVGVGVSARRAFRRIPGEATGAVATLCVFAVHAGLDWDWEMPGVSLVALLLAGALIAWSELPATAAEPVG
jgi:O-antigen ligase/polysaccharide polymerase Wzy-like membrane protein